MPHKIQKAHWIHWDLCLTFFRKNIISKTCILKTVLVPNYQTKLKTCKELKNLHKQKIPEKCQRSQAQRQEPASAYLKCACHKKRNLWREHRIQSINRINPSIAQNDPINSGIRLRARQVKASEARDEGQASQTGSSPSTSSDAHKDDPKVPRDE